MIVIVSGLSLKKDWDMEIKTYRELKRDIVLHFELIKVFFNLIIH